MTILGKLKKIILRDFRCIPINIHELQIQISLFSSKEIFVIKKNQYLGNSCAYWSSVYDFL